MLNELNECNAKLADLEKLKSELASAESKLKQSMEEKEKLEKSTISSRQAMYKIVLSKRQNQSIIRHKKPWQQSCHFLL